MQRRIIVRPATEQWTPYRNLIYSAYDENRKRIQRAGRYTLQHLNVGAQQMANAMLIDSYDPGRVREDRQWDWVHGLSPRTRGTHKSLSFQRFMMRHDHRARRALEEIAMCHWSCPHDYRQVVARTFNDYHAIGETVPKLSPGDVAHFIRFYWDWGTDQDYEGQKRYIQEHMDGDAYSIFIGQKTIQDVRVQYGALTGYQREMLLRRVAMNVLSLADKVSRALHGMGSVDTQALSHFAGFLSSAGNFAKLEADIAQDTDVERSLQDFIETQLADDDFNHNPPKVSDLQDINLSPEDLYRENEEGLELTTTPDDEMPFYDSPQIPLTGESPETPNE